MRQDVKLGVVISAVLVLVAGGYYLSRDSAESTIPIGDSPALLADSAAKEPTSAKKQPAIPQRKRTANAKRAANKKVTSRGNRVAGLDPNLANPAAGANAKTKTLSSTPAAMKPIGQSSGGDSARAPGRPVEKASPKATSPASASRDDSRLANRYKDKTLKEVADRSRTKRTGQPKSRPSSPALARNSSADRNRPAAPRRSVPLIGRSRTAGDAAVETHRVQPGDTFSQLAVRYYGSARFTQFLIGANPQAGNPNSLAIGTVINIPPRPTPTESATTPTSTRPGTSSSSRTHTVRPGDSFYAIARDVLGDASRWRELYELNKELVGGDAKNLQVGQVIQLPSP